MHLPNHIQGLETVQNDKLSWVNIEKPTRDKLDIISPKFSLHELNIEDCLSKNQLPKIDRYEDHIFIILQFPTTHKENIMGNSPGYLLHSILDTLVDDMLHILMKIIGNLDDIEDAVFDDKVAVAKEITILRREITILRRVVLPLKRIMSEIISRDVKKFSNADEEEDLISYFDDVNDHIFKVL